MVIANQIRLLKKWCQKSFFLFVCFSISAQTNSFLDIGQWVGERFVWGNQRDYDGYIAFDFAKGHITKQHVPFVSLPKTLDYPEGTNRFTFGGERPVLPDRMDFSIGQSKIFFNNGEPYAIARGGNPRTMQLAGYLNEVWTPIAGLETNSQGVILPLMNGRFLVGLADGHIADEDQQRVDPNPFAVYRVSGGRLRFDRSIDLEPELEGINLKRIAQALSLDVNHFAITDEHYTYVCSNVGALFVFSKRSGNLVRTVLLYPELAEHLRSDKPIVPPIVWAQPTKSGDILISAWSAKTTIESISTYELINTMSRSLYIEANAMPFEEGVRRFQEGMKQIEELRDSIRAIDPMLRWYSYTPGATTVKREPHSPSGGKDILESAEEYRNFLRWVLNENREIFYVNINFINRLTSDTHLSLEDVGKQFLLASPEIVRE